ncbi:MAG: transposase [Archaeoglobus sp.]|nr:transposase [Archaeoglobus sp.]
MKITYVDAKGTSSLVCGVKLSPNGCKQMKCSECGLEEDRDVTAVKNPLRRYQMDVGASVHPESPPMIGGGKG